MSWEVKKKQRTLLYADVSALLGPILQDKTKVSMITTGKVKREKQELAGLLLQRDNPHGNTHHKHNNDSNCCQALETLFDSPVLGLDPQQQQQQGHMLRFGPRPTGLASLGELFSFAQRIPGALGTSQMVAVSAEDKDKDKDKDKDSDKETTGWPAGTAIELFDYSSGGNAFLLSSTAVACAEVGMRVVFFDSTQSVRPHVIDDYLSILSTRDKERYQKLKKKSNQLYKAISVVRVSDVWDLIDKISLLTASSSSSSEVGGNAHFVGILGLPGMIEVLGPHFLYQSTAEQHNQTSSSGGSTHRRKISSGEPTLRSLLHRLGIAIKGLAARGSTVVTVNTPIDAEHYLASKSPFALGRAWGESVLATEGFVCCHHQQHLTSILTESPCSCGIVRMASLRLFQDVFDITMDLTPSHVASGSTQRQGELIVSCRTKPNFLNDKSQYCVFDF
jgi:hypothetical protein